MDGCEGTVNSYSVKLQASETLLGGSRVLFLIKKLCGIGLVHRLHEPAFLAVSVGFPIS